MASLGLVVSEVSLILSGLKKQRTGNCSWKVNQHRIRDVTVSAARYLHFLLRCVRHQGSVFPWQNGVQPSEHSELMGFCKVFVHLDFLSNTSEKCPLKG